MVEECMGSSGKSGGFTLIELMIVVSIVAIVAAIAIPSLLSARISGNEASAVSSLRTISTVTEQYRTRFGRYAATMTNMQNAGYVDEVLGSSVKSGYDFFYSGSTTVWTCLANPRDPGITGERYFFANERGVIRFNTQAVAGSSDPAID